MTMESLLLAATAVDLVAVVALGWVVVRGARARELAGATQREALERLRGELAHLLDEAERRARALERAAGGAAPEEGSAAARGGATRAARLPVAAPAPAPAHAPLPRPRSWVDGDGTDDDRLRDALVGDDTAADLAELRLRRELELSLGKGRLA